MSDNRFVTDEQIRLMLEARGRHGISVADLVASVEGTIEQTTQVPHELLRARWWRAVAATAFASVAIIALLVAGPKLWPSIHDLHITTGGLTEPALEAGRYRPTMFDPPITFSVPAGGWAPAVDLSAELQLRRVRPGEEARPDNGALTIVRINNVMTGACGYNGNVPWAAGADSPHAFLAWLGGQLPLGQGAPRAVTIAGKQALEISFGAPVDFRHTCDYGFLLTDVGPSGDPHWVEIPVDGREVRLQVLDLSGQPVLVMTEGGKLNWYEEAAAAADEVISSMSFEEIR